MSLLALPARSQTLSSVSLSPTSVLGGVASTGTVTLSANAPTGGKVVTLSSGNTSAATVPASVTVASGTKTKTFTVTTLPQAVNTSAVISAVLSGVTKTATLTVTAPAMSAASVSPTSVTGGTGATLTVTLTGNAPSAGTVVTLSSGTPAAATLPTSVTVASGSKTATALVSTIGVDATVTVTLTATAGGVAKTASLTVSKPALTGIAVSPATIAGGGTATGSVNLNGQAGPAKVTIALSSSNTNVATVPASVQVAAGQSTATFTVTGTSLPAGGAATITAALSGVNKTANVTLQASAALQDLSLSTSEIRGGLPVSGTVTLTAPAPSGGAAVSLSSGSPTVASVPASVNVPQGQTSATFAVTTFAVSAPATATVTASRSGVTRTATLNLHPASLTGLSISPQSIPAGTTATGTLTLDGPAGPAGATIALASSDTAVATVPATALIAAGQTTGSFTITGAAVTSDGVSNITGTLASEVVGAEVVVTRTIGTLTGTVRDAATGFTLPSVRIQLAEDLQRKTWTDRDGRFEIAEVSAGSHSVVASLERYSPATSAPVTVTNGQLAAVPAISLAPLPGTIAGTIVDQGNGDRPLAGAVVTEATGLHSATTDANGHFEISGLAPGFTFLAVRKDGYRPAATGELPVDGDGTTHADLGLSPVWEMDEPGEIEGVVRDSAGSPVPGVAVSVVGSPDLGVTTGSDGRYSLTVPAAAGWILQAQKPGFSRAVSKYLLASMGDLRYHVALDFVLAATNATGTLELRTFDPVSRGPFRADLWFRTPSGVWHAPVPDSGARTISGVPAGRVWDCLGQRSLVAGGTLTLRCTGDAVVPPGAPRWAAGGIVVDRYASSPLAGATVTFVNGATTVPVVTDQNGLFSIVSGPLGDWSATASAPGFLDTGVWGFTAQENPESGSFYGATFWPEKPGGSLSIVTPAEGAVVTSAHLTLEVAFSAGRPNDQLLWVHPCLSTGTVTAVTTHYGADGMDATVTIDGWFPNGPLTIGLEAVTQTGAWFSLQRNVTVDLPTHPTSLVLSPATAPAGSVVTATVTVDPPAPVGSATVFLSSSTPAVAVPPSLAIPEGATSRSFEVVVGAVTIPTVATVTASVGAFSAAATLTVNPTSPPPVGSDLSEGDPLAWQAFADPPYTATVAVDATHVKSGASSLRFVTDSGSDCGLRYVVPGGAHWDLRGVRFLTFWSFGSGTEAYQGEQPVVVLRGPGGSIRLRPPSDQTVNGEWRFHRVPLGDASDWAVTTEGSPSLGDITSFEIHQDVWGAGLTVFYDDVSFTSDIPEDLAEGTAALWGTFASDSAPSSVVDDSSLLRSGATSLRFDTASGFDTGLVYPMAGEPHWDLSDVRSLSFWIRPENDDSFQENQPVVVLRSPSGSIRLEPGDILVNTPGWRYYEVPLDGTFPWTRTQSGTPDLEDVNAIEIHDDTWGNGFRLYVDGVSVGRPLPLLVLPASSTPAGSTVTANVFLSEAAPAGGRTVQLSSSDPYLASVPASVVVPEGARSATFPVSAGSVTLGTPVTLTATDRGFSARASFRVDPVADVASLTLGASTVIGGLTVSGSVTIGAPAWVGGTAVFLTSSNPAKASVPPAVTVPTGATTAAFSVTTGAVASETPVTFTANAGAATAAASLTVVPAPPPEIAGLATNPPWAIAGATNQLTVSLAAPAPLGGAVVHLVSSEPSIVSVPNSITVPGGTMSTSALASVAPSAPLGTIVLTGSVGSSTRAIDLPVVRPAELAAFSLSPTSVWAGSSISAIVTLTSPAPPGGRTIVFTTSSEAALPVPSSVSIPEGQAIGTFGIPVPASAPDALVTVTATQGLIQKSATVTTVKLARAWSLTATPAVVLPGDTVSCVLGLSAAAPTGGFTIPITGFAPGIADGPSTLTVPAGENSVSFSAQIPLSSRGGRINLSVMDEGYPRSAYFDVVALASAAALPSPAGPDRAVLLQLRLTATVPQGRTVPVDLTSSNPSVAGLPASVALAAGQWSIDVPVSRVNVVSDTNVNLSATAFGVTKSSTLSLEPLKVRAVRSTFAVLEARVEGSGSVELNSPAPAGGATIHLTSGPAIELKVGLNDHGSNQLDVAVPQGQTSTSFDMVAGYVGEPTPTTITATLGSSSASTSVTVVPAVLRGVSGPSSVIGGVRFRGRLDFTGVAPFPVPATFESSDPLLLTIPNGVDPTSYEYSGWGVGTSWAFGVRTQPVTVPTPVTITVRYLDTVKSRTLTLEPVPTGKVVGQVVGLSASYGDAVPLQGADVRVLESASGVSTDSDGVFSIDTPSGPFSISAGKPPDWASERVGPFEPSPAGSFAGVVELSKAATVVVEVRQSPANGFASEAIVRMLGNGDPATTDSSGRAYLRVKPEVPGYVRATKDGFEPANSNPFAATLSSLVYVSLTLYPSVSPTSLSIAPSAIRGGSSATGQVVLSAAAPPSGSRVALSSSDPGILVVPADVFVAPGSFTGSFEVRSNPVAEARTVTVTATNAGVSRTVQVSVAPMTLTGLSLSPAAVPSGAVASGTVTLDGLAPEGGLPVALSSSDPAVAQVPPTVLVPSGATQATFAVTTNGVSETKLVSVTAAISGSSKSAVLEVRIGPPTVTGAAPGVALPGASGIVVYGTGLGAATGVLLSGPVYPIGGTTAVCNIRGTQGPICPEVFATATPSTDGRSLTFTLPSNAALGTYLLEARIGSVLSVNGVPFLVEQASPAFEVVAPEDHKWAQRIHPGQIVEGTLSGTAPNCPYGATDYNQYFFFATAGSRVNLRMERVDSSVPWSDPSSLDPQLEVVAPDGFIYGNLARFNDRPGVDFNATITNASLPKTGLYVILAETARGSGAYRLSFSFSSLAPASPEDRVIPAAGNHFTGHVGDAITAWAQVLDPRGHPLSGASLSFQQVVDPGDAGTVQFTPGANVESSSSGVAAVNATLTSFGRARFAPSLQQTFAAPAAEGLELPALSAEARPDEQIPLYPAVAMRPFAIGAFDGDLLEVESSRFERFPLAPRRARSGPIEETPAAGGVRSLASSARASTQAQAYGPEDEARGEVPVARFEQPGLSATSCQDGLRFHAFAVLPSAQINAPLSVTLEDLTPSTGQETPNGPVGDKGIYGHRIEKEIRLRIRVHDASGNEPDYPVLVSLSVGGRAAGQLILDPDGSRIECPTATFIWHERDANGVIVALNEIVGYRLGTYSDFVGLDRSLKPVWNWTELFQVKTFTPGQEQPSVQVFGVHPEPGKPDRVFCRDYFGQLCGDSFRYWTGYKAYENGRKQDGTPRFETNFFTILSAYHLVDKYENTLYGYSGTSVSEAVPSSDVQFAAHEPGEANPQSYKLRTRWTNDPSWPSGLHPATLSVHYPEDPDWPAGDVTREITLSFDAGVSHALSKHGRYDLIRPDGTRGVDDGTFPIRAYAKATAAQLPKTEAGDGTRLVLLAYRGEVVPGEWPELEPTEAGSRVWTPDGDHWRIEETRTTSFLESAGPSAFRFTLIDHDWNVIQDGEFRVHRCPRFDHAAPGSGRPCDLAPVLSVNGRIDSLALNPGGAGASESRGYLAIELTRAPEGLGIYYVRVESLSNEYRIRRQADFVTSSAAVEGEFQGAFKLVDVADFPCPDARCGIPECGTCTGSPNYVSTGTYTTSATDLVVPTSGPAISVTRRYVSTPTADGLVGPGWTSSLESRVYLAPYISGGVRLGTEANVVLPTGMRYKFRLNPITGHYDPPAGRRDDLVRTADGSFDLFLERGSGSVYRFDKHGLLVSETDEFGNVVAWERSPEGRLTRIADLSGTGRYVTVGWTTGGKVHTLTDSASRTITYDYDPQGRLVGVTDPAARRTQYDYLRGRDSTALLTRISDPWGRAITDVTYDVADRTKTYTEQGRTYSYTYTASNRTTKSDDSGHSTENYFDPDSGAITARSDPGDSFNKVFDSEGRPTQVTDAAGVVTGYSYDDEGHVLTVTRNSGQTGAVRYDYAYDPAFPDKVASVTPKNPASNAFDQAWQGWRYEYHPTGSTRPGGLKKVYRVASDGATADSVSEYEYDAQGRVTRQTTAGGAQTDYAYDNVGNLQTVTGPAGTTGRPVTSYQHDALGRVADVTDPLGKVTHYTYDTLGRVLIVTLPAVGGRTFTTTYSYDHLDGATGFLYTEITDPNGRLTRLGYDVDGRLRRSVDASGGATLYGYSGKHLTTITDPNGNVTTYAYDGAQRLASTSFPDGGQETYTYWNDGLLRTKTDRRGTVVTYTYDAFKRLVTKAYSTGGTVTYAYDGQKLLTVTDTTVTPAETHTFSYDSRYRLSSAAQAGRGTTGYTYTADDRVETLTLASGPTATYGYHPDGSLHTLQWSPAAGVFTWDYTARGQYDTLTFPNGQFREYGYDDQGRLTSLTNALGASTLASFAYGYDVDPLTGQPTLLGQRTGQTATLPAQGLANAVTRYGYDPLYQLTRAEYPAGAPFNSEVHTWGYDSIGNRLTKGLGANVQTYTYLKSPGTPFNGQRLEGDGVDAMTYDAAGNLGTRQGPAGNFIFGYDPENRLKTITGAETATYTYDYQGRRTSKTVGGVTTTYLYDGLNLVAETTGGQTTYFLNGPGIDEPLAMSRAGAVSYFSVDGLGSVVATNDPSGSVTHSVVFDAWGKVKAETGTREHPFTYTGREAGEAGFHFYRARFYQPSVGRFIQEDPIGFAPGPNSYEYANANPINSTDPSGLEPEPVEVFTSEWVTSFKLLFDFVTGTGPGAHQYGPGSSRVQGLKLTPGLDAARKEFRAGGCRPSDPFPIGFGLTGLISSGPNAVRQQVGGFVVTIDPLPNGFAKFTARNTLSAKSFFYHLPFVPASVPRRDDTPVPFSDIKEVFWWVEKLPCCEAK